MRAGGAAPHFLPMMVRARARRICCKNEGRGAAQTSSRRWCAPARGGSVGEITVRRQTQSTLCIMVEHPLLCHAAAPVPAARHRQARRGDRAGREGASRAAPARRAFAREGRREGQAAPGRVPPRAAARQPAPADLGEAIMSSIPKPPARPPDEVPWPKPPPPPRPPAPPPAARRRLSRPILYLRLPDRTRMPRPKVSALTGTAELNATIERVAPAVLELLADGTPRTKAAIT